MPFTLDDAPLDWVEEMLTALGVNLTSFDLTTIPQRKWLAVLAMRSNGRPDATLEDAGRLTMREWTDLIIGPEPDGAGTQDGEVPAAGDPPSVPAASGDHGTPPDTASTPGTLGD